MFTAIQSKAQKCSIKDTKTQNSNVFLIKLNFGVFSDLFRASNQIRVRARFGPELVGPFTTLVLHAGIGQHCFRFNIRNSSFQFAI